MRRTTSLAFVLLLLFPAAAHARSLDIDNELEAYWGKEREKTILKKPKFVNLNHFGISLYGGVVPNDDFYIYIPVGLRVNYFFHDYVAAEIFGSYFISTNSRLQDFLESEEMQDPDKFPEKSLGNLGVSVLFLPFHGKMQVLNAKMLHFDVGLAAGYSVVVTEARAVGGNLQQKTETKWNAAGGHVGATVRMLFLDWLGVRLDYRAYIYKSEHSGEVEYPNEISLGLEFRI